MTRTIGQLGIQKGSRKIKRVSPSKSNLVPISGQNLQFLYSSSEECIAMQGSTYREAKAAVFAGIDTGSSEELDTLIRFDLTAKFGPGSGLTRLQRWERAQRLGLEPPAEIPDILLRAEIDCLTRFDLAATYGPYLGIRRLDRWERAERLGLEPPGEVRDILIRSGSARNTENCGCSGRIRLW